MTKRVEVRIASDGDSRSTQVIVDGKHVENVVRVIWSCAVDEVGQAMIEIRRAPMFAIGELDGTKLICEICGHSSLHQCELPEVTTRPTLGRSPFR